MRIPVISASLLLVLTSACGTNPMPNKGTGGQTVLGSAGDGSRGQAGSLGGQTAGAGGNATSGDSLSSSDTCPSNSICFSQGRGQGLMSGWAWVDLSKYTTMDSPTCGAGHAAITSDALCPKEIAWSTPDSLCVDGFVPALLPPMADPGDWDNWGMAIGVNAAEPNSGIGPDVSPFKSVAFTFSGEPQKGLRAVVHRKGDPEGVTYCYDAITSGKVVNLTKFNTKCWGEDTTVNLTQEDLQDIDQIGLMIASRSVAVTMKDLCLARISFQ